MRAHRQRCKCPWTRPPSRTTSLLWQHTERWSRRYCCSLGLRRKLLRPPGWRRPTQEKRLLPSLGQTSPENVVEVPRFWVLAIVRQGQGNTGYSEGHAPIVF